MQDLPPGPSDRSDAVTLSTARAARQTTLAEVFVQLKEKADVLQRNVRAVHTESADCVVGCRRLPRCRVRRLDRAA